MSKWYKKAQLGNNLVFVISTYLRNAKNNPQVANVNDDIANQMEGADDSSLLSSSISSAVNIVSAEQGGYLTPSQEELIQNLNNRNMNKIKDPFAIQQIQPINNLEIQNHDDSQGFDSLE